MFCTKCGSVLEDGAKFCTNCGAQTPYAQTPAPAESTAQTEPVPAAPAQAPAAPQAGGWQQPQQPAAPQAGSWQQPQQPPQWQQIQQQWQQQQARQQMNRQQPQGQQWQQPPQQWQQQPQQQWQQQTRGGSPAKPKKGKGGLIAGIIAGVLVIAVGVGGFVWPGFFKGKKSSADSGVGSGISMALAEKFSTPEEYYQNVETKNADQLANHVSSVYDNVFLSNASSDDICAEGTLRIEPGDKVRELLLDAIGEKLEQINPGDDLKWLKNITFAYDVSKKDTSGMLNLALQLNGTDLLHVNAVIQSKDGSVWLSVPELSDKYMQTTLEDLKLDQFDLSKLNIGSSALNSMLGDLAPEDSEKLDPVIKALPDAKTVNKVLDKYLSEAVDCIEDVEKKTDTLTVEDVSAEYTVLVSTITPETAVKIVEKLGPELKEDKDIRKAILDVAAAAGEDGDVKYKEFTDKIDSLLNDTSKITENMKDNLVVTVYLDKSGDVHGRILDAGSQKLELLMPEKGGQFGLTIRYTKEGAVKLLLNGSGKRSGDKLTGDLDLQVDGEYYAVLGLDGFDIEKVKDGFLAGGVEVKPTASFWKKITETSKGAELPESIKSLLDTLVLRFDLNTSKDKAAVTMTLTNGSDKLLSIAVDGKKTGAKKISTVDGIEPSEWAKDITLDKLEKVVASIEKAGVPTAYTDLLDDTLGSSFS